MFHENNESMPRLAAAISRHAEIEAIRVASPARYLRALLGRDAGFGWADHAGASWQRLVLVPGLRRLSQPSASMLRHHYRRSRARGVPDAVLVDSPYLFPLAEASSEPIAYVAADAYAFYDWDHDRTVRLERALLERSAITFAVAHRLIDDFNAVGINNVVHLGTAVSQEFVAACRVPGLPPSDLQALPGPRIGSVGIINRTYDWPLIEALADARPGVAFVFIGPIVEQDGEASRRIRAVFSRPNVHWLGPRPQVDLPAYVAAFDALLNPLTVDDHSDRRFPLRLCEYVATDRPVLSTAIHELPWFPADIVALDDPNAAPEQVDAVLRPVPPVDKIARRSWIAENTWDARARRLISALETTVGARSGP